MYGLHFFSIFIWGIYHKGGAFVEFLVCSRRRYLIQAFFFQPDVDVRISSMRRVFENQESIRSKCRIYKLYTGVIVGWFQGLCCEFLKKKLFVLDPVR